jgi:hypothetical protein
MSIIPDALEAEIGRLWFQISDVDQLIMCGGMCLSSQLCGRPEIEYGGVRSTLGKNITPYLKNKLKHNGLEEQLKW